MKVIRFDIGDFIYDGHNITEPILVKCSHSSDDIAEAYWKAVDTTGFKLHDRVYKHYEDNKLHNKDLKNLETIGFEFPEDFDKESGRASDILKMFLHMVKIGNPNIEFEIIEENESFFICGHKKRNFGLGYGLFDAQY